MGQMRPPGAPAAFTGSSWRRGTSLGVLVALLGAYEQLRVVLWCGGLQAFGVETGSF